MTNHRRYRKGDLVQLTEQITVWDERIPVGTVLRVTGDVKRALCFVEGPVEETFYAGQHVRSFETAVRLNEITFKE